MRIGIDVGGTKIEGIALDENHAVRFRRRVSTPRGSYPDTLRAIAGLVGAIDAETGGRAPIGVGIPGTISPVSGLVKNANSTWLNGRPLADDLPRLLERPVRLANDANCFALSEAVDGAAAGAPVVFGVIVGTGTGGGIVVNGRVVVGANAVAGEWGHNPLPAPAGDERPGPPCYCGRSGCLETFLSGPGLLADYQRSGQHDAESPEDVVRLAEAGSAAAHAALERYENRMARGLASVINVLDPDVIVLGGGMSNVDRWYETVPRLWGPHVFSDAVRTPLVRAAHGDSSGVRGAAWLWE